MRISEDVDSLSRNLSPNCKPLIEAPPGRAGGIGLAFGNHQSGLGEIPTGGRIIAPLVFKLGDRRVLFLEMHECSVHCRSRFFDVAELFENASQAQLIPVVQSSGRRGEILDFNIAFPFCDALFAKLRVVRRIADENVEAEQASDAWSHVRDAE